MTPDHRPARPSAGNRNGADRSRRDSKKTILKERGKWENNYPRGSHQLNRRTQSMRTLLQDLKFGLRMLAKNPGLTATVLLTLALGIGANTAIFTVDYATLLVPLPYPKPDQVVMVWSKIQTFHNGVSAGDFTDWKQQSTSFQDLNAWTGGGFNIATHDQPELVDGDRLT